MDRDPIEGLGDDIAAHLEFVRDRDPAYARTLELLAPRIEGPIGERIRAAWRDRDFGPFYERPLVILTSLREDAIHDGERHPLWAALGSAQPDPGALTGAAIEASLGADRERVWRSLAEGYVQTNETSRALAWMWPAAISAAADPEREIELIDMGASAGLNLVADRMPWPWTDQDGEPIGPLRLPAIAARRGFDLRPLDLLDADDERWLKALIWPSQRERQERFALAVEGYRTLAEAGAITPIERAGVDEAAERLEPRGAAAPRGLVYQTIMHDYLPDEVRRRYDAAMSDWLARSDAGAALWVELELLEGGESGDTAVALQVHVSTAAAHETFLLARSSPHPSVLTTDPAAVEALRARLRATSS